MEEYRLVADSSCDIYTGHPQATFSVDLVIVPLTLIIGDKEFVDLPETNRDELFREMNSFKGASSSSCPSMDSFHKAFQGAKRSIAVTMTSGLSGTYDIANMAKKMALEEDPSKEIIIIDSRSTSGTIVHLLRYADELLKDGVPFSQIEDLLNERRNNIHFVCVFSSFGNLIKTGRMPKAAGKLATILNMRAIAIADDKGKYISVDKARGEKNAIEKMKKQFPSDMTDKPAIITHCYNESGALAVAAMLKETYGTTDITILETRCLCTFYTDNEGLIVSF